MKPRQNIFFKTRRKLDKAFSSKPEENYLNEQQHWWVQTSRHHPYGREGKYIYYAKIEGTLLT
jgi:hypothetical protein